MPSQACGTLQTFVDGKLVSFVGAARSRLLCASLFALYLGLDPVSGAAKPSPPWAATNPYYYYY